MEQQEQRYKLWQTRDSRFISKQSVMTNFFTLLGLQVELIISIVKPKGSIEGSTSMRKYSITVTSNSPVIYYSLLRSLFFRSMLRTNSRYCHNISWWWSTVDVEVINSASLCGTITGTGIINGMESRNCLSIINLIKERYFFDGVPVSVVKWLLNKSRAIYSENSLILINFP